MGLWAVTREGDASRGFYTPSCVIVLVDSLDLWDNATWAFTIWIFRVQLQCHVDDLAPFG